MKVRFELTGFRVKQVNLQANIQSLWGFELPGVCTILSKDQNWSFPKPRSVKPEVVESTTENKSMTNRLGSESAAFLMTKFNPNKMKILKILR